MIPDPATAQIDPFYAHPTLSLICTIVDPITKQPYSRDPRNIAKKAEAYLKQTGIADTVVLRPRGRVLRLRRRPLRSVAAERGLLLPRQRRGRVEHRPRGVPEPRLQDAPQGGLLPRPADRHARRPAPGDDDRRSWRAASRSRSATTRWRRGGQCEIDMKFNRLLPCADQLMWFKYVVKNVARKHGKTATFMPKPLFGDNGSGMHCHQSLWKEGKPLFAGDGYARPLARWRSTTSAASSSTPSRSRAHQPDDQQLPPPGAGLRGAGQPGVLEPQPLGVACRIPITGPEPQDAPHRGPLPRPELQPVPGVQRDADGRPRRHPEQDRPGRSARQGHLRALARGAEGRAAHAGQPRGGARRARAGPRVPAPGRRLHQGRHPRVDRLQAQRRSSTRSACARRRTSSSSTSTFRFVRGERRSRSPRAPQTDRRGAGLSLSLSLSLLPPRLGGGREGGAGWGWGVGGRGCEGGPEGWRPGGANDAG